MPSKRKTHHVAYLRLRSTTGTWLVSPELRPYLVADAGRHGTNLTETAIAILAQTYRIPYEPSSRRTSPSSNGDVINMRLPIRLWKAIRKSADKAGRRDMDEVRHALSDHYGLPLPSRAPAA